MDKNRVIIFHKYQFTGVFQGLILFIFGIVLVSLIINNFQLFLFTVFLTGMVVTQNQLPKYLNFLPTWFPFISKPVKTEQNKVETDTNDHVVELENRCRMAYKILDTTPGFLALIDTSCSQVVYANHQFSTFFGWSQSEYKNYQYSQIEHFVHPDDLQLYQDFSRKLVNGIENQFSQVDIRMRNLLGDWRWISQRCSILEKKENSLDYIVMLSGDDITETRIACDHLHYVSTHDALTGLYNWAFFKDSLLNIQKDELFPTAIVMMDMDNLKKINDTLGHQAGDEFLYEISMLLKETFRACDVIARVGGDEFAVILPGVNEKVANEIVKRVRNRFKYALTKSGLSLDVLSFGVCAAKNSYELSMARKVADKRMYQDKQERKARLQKSVCETRANVRETQLLSIQS